MVNGQLVNVKRRKLEHTPNPEQNKSGCYESNNRFVVVTVTHQDT